MQPSPIPPVPEQTAAVARAAFRHGTLCLRLRDEFGAVYEDADFAALFPMRGQPALPPGAALACVVWSKRKVPEPVLLAVAGVIGVVLHGGAR